MVERLEHFPHAIIFDWDNTLVDTWPTIYEGLCATFEAMGHTPWSYEDVVQGRGGIHRSLRESFPEIFGDRWEEAKKIYHTTFAEIHIDKLSPIDGVKEMLESIADFGIPMMVVSNKTGKYLRQEVEHLGWGGFFTSVVGALDAPRDKPHVDPVKLALADSDIILSDRVWFVGDSQTDIDCARNASCSPVLFVGGKKAHHNTEILENSYQLASYDRLTERLRYLNFG